MNGIVKNLSVNTPGAVVGAGEALMEILLVDDRLVVEAKISPSEIAFVRTGMDAVIKIDAYDYTIFGDLTGTLTYLSADTLMDDGAGRGPVLPGPGHDRGVPLLEAGPAGPRDTPGNDRDGRDQDREEHGLQLPDQATGQDRPRVLHRPVTTGNRRQARGRRHGHWCVSVFCFLLNDL